MNRNAMQEETNCIRKCFRDRISYENEREIYRLMGGTGLVPELLGCGEACLFLEKKAGVPLSEYLSGTDADIAALAGGLADWMLRFQTVFHEKTGRWAILEDLDARSLLVAEPSGAICGTGFERRRFGSREDAFAVLPAMLLSAYPEESGENRLARAVMSGFRGSLDRTLMDRSVARMCAELASQRSAMTVIRRSSCGILAGGKGSRMGGLDKSALMLGRFSFLEHLLHTAQCFDRILISSNLRPVPAAGGFQSGLHVPDKYRDAGPMGGLEALLTACETETLLILPCDTPLIRRSSIFELYRKLNGACDAVIARSGGRRYPTVGVYKRSMLPAVRAALGSGSYRMTALLNGMHLNYVNFENEAELLNVNTAEDLERLRDRIGLLSGS